MIERQEELIEPEVPEEIAQEEVFELSPRLPDVVALQTRDKTLDGEGEISLRRLIKEALRMRPSRIVVGEVREAEALDLLIALNSGVPGMASIHANSAREAIRKLSTLPPQIWLPAWLTLPVWCCCRCRS